MQKAEVNDRRFSWNTATILFPLCALEGIAALIGLSFHPSEPESAVFLGLSLVRLVIYAAAFLMVLAFIFLAWSARNHTAGWRSIQTIGEKITSSPGRAFSIFTAVFALLLIVLSILLLAVSPAAKELTLLKTVLNRLGYLLLWGALILSQFLLWMLLDARIHRQMDRISLPLRAGVLLAAATLTYLVFLKVYLAATWDLRLRDVENYIFLPALFLTLWGIIRYLRIDSARSATMERLMILCFIGVTIYTIYWHTAQWAKFEQTRDGATWHLLAQSFLEGRLYLQNPSSLHDMTLYKGEWYVPSPPLPALVLMPLIALFGIENINMVQFSILIGAANAVVIYALLAQASERRLIPTATSGNILLTVMVVLGTTHWWLSVYGVFWYLSQLLTLLFAGLAVYLALKQASAWWIGLCLGIAILSRPNVFTLWPLLAGITFYLEKQNSGNISWKRMIFWAAQSAVPMIAAVGCLLVYNYMRFDNFLDFGYVTVNSSSWIMEAVQTYGMFHVHFLPINLEMMFLRMPVISFKDQQIAYSPGLDGTSILAMSPALIYLFRRFKLNWWTLGAWISIIITAGLLLFYHNTGAWQLGYRYLLDFILPVVLLTAVGLSKRTSRIFIALVLVSILINAANVHWWFSHM